MALSVLLLLPGSGLALLGGAPPPTLEPALPSAARDLADRAFVGSFDQLAHVDGAADLAALTPTLESVLRFYALDRGFTLSPPRTPDASGPDALPAALQALAAATGKPLDASQLQQARALPAELQEALARIVLAYLQAARDYALATNGLSMADLAALARGDAPSVQPDAGRMASAALLLDHAVRESAPALRKWGLLLSLEERTTHPRLPDFQLDALLRAGRAAQSLRDAADLASVMQGWLPTQARFRASSSSPSESWTQLYRGLGIPLFPTDAVAFQLLDAQPAPMQALAMTLGDGLLQGSQALLAAEGIVKQDEIDAAYAALAAMDLEAMKAADPATLDTSQLQAIVEVLERADQALMLRLQGAAVLADALEQAYALAPAVAALPVGGYGTQSHVVPGQFPLLEVPLPSGGGACLLGEHHTGQLFLHCSGQQNVSLGPNVKYIPDDKNLQLIVYVDRDGDFTADEGELLLRTPALADANNHILLKDPFGFVLVGDQERSVYDERYGHVNVSLRAENGTIFEERQLLYQGAAAPAWNSLLDYASGLRGTPLRPLSDLNRTLFEPQQNGVLNFTVNPNNHTLAIVDLGGDDLYTHRMGGADQALTLYNNSYNDDEDFEGLLNPIGNGCQPSGLLVVSAFLGECDPDQEFFAFGETGGERLYGNQVFVSINSDDPDRPGNTYLNATNLTIPLRLGVVLDVSGDDVYQTQWNYTMGAANRGIGLLWDAERCHRDQPDAVRHNCNAPKNGDDAYFGTFFSMGAGTHRGVGLFLDEYGDDVHTALNVSIGAGADRGVGLAIDLHGEDRWFGGNYTMGFGGRDLSQTHQCPGEDCPEEDNGVGAPLFGHPQSVTSRLGLGLLLDRRGDDVYDQVNRTANQGKGWPALGLLLDLAGADRGLQTNLTARGDLGAVALGFQENTLFSFNAPSTGLANPSWSFYNGFGGGLVVDAEVADSDPAATAAESPSRGAGMGATELEGDTNTINCHSVGGNTVWSTVFGEIGTMKCAKRDDGVGPPEGGFEWKTLSRQKFLLRIPGALGFGGTLSNDGAEAPRNDEEHLLQFDLGGNDVYRGPHAGAAVPNLTALDTEGNKGNPDPLNPQPDAPVNNAPLFQGGLLAPVSLLVDVHGSDLYDGRAGVLNGTRRNLTTPSLGGAWMGIGMLHDLGTAPVSGVLPRTSARPAGCDGATVNDAYVGFNKTIGYGALYGIGVLVDAAGDDCYVALTGDTGAPSTTPSYSLGAGRLGGVGVLLDPRGNDTYASGNLSQGVGILEGTNDHLPKRVGLGASTQCVGFHDLPSSNCNSNLRNAAASAAQALGALVDARGHDRYAFGALSQGYGEEQRNATTGTSDPNAVSPTFGTRKFVAGLFVDDGFERDAYRNASDAPVLAGHRDNSFWCSQPQAGALSGELAGLRSLPRVDSVLQDGLNSTDSGALADAVAAARGAASTAFDALAAVLPPEQRPSFDDTRAALEAQLDAALGSGDAGAAVAAAKRFQREVDRLTESLAEGPNREATCLQLELEQGSTAARPVDLGTLGRGFDNLDFFANFLLAAGRFGEEFARSRSVLSAPAVVDVKCVPLNHSGFADGDCEGRTVFHRVQVDATVLWGPPAFAYNANQMLRLICAKATGDDAACQQLLFTGGLSGRTACSAAYGAAGFVPPDPFLGCDNLFRGDSGAPVSLNVTGNATRLVAGQEAAKYPGLGNALRRVEFRLRPAGADMSEDVLLGVYDRRDGVQCTSSVTVPCSSNVTAPNATGVLSLRWDALHLVQGADGLPTLQAPDGTYSLVVQAYFQPDGIQSNDSPTVNAALSPDDQRYALNRLGDEYGFYPGVAAHRVVVDNPPVVYQLQYEDVSLAEDADLPPNRELRLNLTVSPRIDPQDQAHGRPYEVHARLLPTDGDRLGLPARAFACDEGDDDLQDELPPDLHATTCAHRPADPASGLAARQRIVAGWPEEDVRSALQDGDFLLQVDVQEPHPDFGTRSTVRCFTRHGHALEASDFEELRGLAQRATNATNLTQTLMDLTQVWEAGQWQGFRVRLLSGTGAGQERRIAASDAHNLTVEVAWAIPPDATSAYAIVASVCKQSLAVDSVKPVVIAHLEPSRVGADGVRYVNRSTAYPGGFTIAARHDAVIPLRFETVNAAQKRSPVMAYDVYAVVREVVSPVIPDASILPAPRVVEARRYLSVDGNVTIPLCLFTGQRRPMAEGPCIYPKAEDGEGLNQSASLFEVAVQVAARDLAGNWDPPVRDFEGLPMGEDGGVVDLDGPESKLCQPQSTVKAGVPEGMPRIRTRERSLPMPWLQDAEGCQGGITPRDNRGVEAMLIAYDVTAPHELLEPADLSRSWEPPVEQQSLGRATFDFDARGLQQELTNNRTLRYMGVARDLAGNLQDRLLQVWSTTFDDNPPAVEVLNLTGDHASITYRWFARDREAPPARVAQAYVEWGTLNLTSMLPELNRTTPAIVGGSTARAVLDGLDQNTVYYLRAVSLDDVGNVAVLPIQAFTSDPVLHLEVASPREGDVLTGPVPLRFNVSDVRVDPFFTYNVSLVLVTPNGTLTLPVEDFARRECVPGEAECPLVNSTIQVARTIASAAFPDAREAFLRIAANNSVNPRSPVVVSVGPLKLDNGPPVTSLNVVAQGGPEWYRTAALLLLEPLDNITEVVHTEYSFDNFTFTPYNASAPPVQDKEGSVPFFFRSVDRAGNVEPLRVVSVNIDKQRPTGNLSINDGALATSEPNVTLLLEARDGLSGIANITLDAGGDVESLERPSRFATGRTLPLTLPAGEGERRVRVRITDLAGNVQELKASILVDTTPPEISAVRVDRVGHTSAALSWRTSELSVSRIEYGPEGALVLANRFQGNDTTLGHVVGLEGLRPSRTYQFRVVAIDALGNRGTARGTFETLPDVTPPGAARLLQAKDLGQGAVLLSWEPAFDDVGVDHYVVLRGTGGQLDELGRAHEVEFVDDRGLPGVTYDYAVQAVDLAGQQGPLSAVVRARATTRPILLDGAVSPDQGTATTVFTYSVVVRDPDGDAPSVARVRVSGQAFELKPQFEGRADFAQGVLFTLAMRLPATTLSGGFPTYQFEVLDARGMVVHPDVPLAGPAVLAPGGILPGLSAASGIFGLPGFELAMAAAAVGIALLALRAKRGRWGK